MRSHIAILFSGLLGFWVSLVGSAASAQNQDPISNVFFGFDFVLHPLAVKWACGGQRDQDLSKIETLIVAFPEDAEHAELALTVVALSEMLSGLESLPQLLGGALSDQQVNQLCAVAIPLTIDWVTPEQLLMHDESGMSEEHQAAWASFWSVVEGFQ